MSTVESERPGLPRAAKIAIVAVAVLAVLAAGGVAAWSISRDGEPVAGLSASAPPPASPSATASPEPSATTVTPAGAIRDPAYVDGQVPTEWGGGWPVDVSCGMPVADLVAKATSEDFQIAVSGGLTEIERGYSLPITITETAGQAYPSYQAGNPLLVWTQAGRVVDASFGWHEGAGYWDAGDPYDAEYVERIDAGMTIDTVATGEQSWACGEYGRVFGDPISISYATPRPAGDYEVMAVSWYLRGDGSDVRFLVSDAVPVTTGEPPAPTGRFTEGYPEEGWSYQLGGTGITCSLPVAELPESDPRFAVTALGAPVFEELEWRLPIRVTTTGAAGQPLPVTSTVLWVQDGVVVDVGTDDWSGWTDAELTGTLDDVAIGSPVDACFPENEEFPEFRTFRPAGDYELIPLVRVGDFSDQAIVLGAPVQVTVGERGRP